MDANHILKTTAALAHELHIQAYLVGGVIRDLIRGKLDSIPDIDVVIVGDLLPFAEALAQRLGFGINHPSQFMTVKLVSFVPSQRIEIDVVRARKEFYPHPGALPVVEAADLNSDLSRRDFTVNAMALELNDFLDITSDQTNEPFSRFSILIDPFQGFEDLKTGYIRILHERSFIDDPTRLIRAIRYMLRISGSLTSRTDELFHQAVETGALKTISGKRIVNELKKMCGEDNYLSNLSCLNQMIGLSNLGLLPKSEEKHFDDLLSSISGTTFKERFNSFMTICYYLTPEEEREAFILKFQLGKRFQKIADLQM